MPIVTTFSFTSLRGVPKWFIKYKAEIGDDDEMIKSSVTNYMAGPLTKPLQLPIRNL
jgi:hypothetical protein